MKPNFFDYEDPAEDIAPRASGLLGSLSEEELNKLAAFAGRRGYPAGAEIIRAGGHDRDLFLVASGRVRTVAPSGAGRLALDAEEFGEGEVFGAASFLDGRPRAASAIASGPVDVLRLSPDNFEQLAAWYPRIALVLMRELGASLSAKLRRHRLVL
jgi:CRP/FNR family transcriptional regulator/CRP/FNR family cyclic AMP-dependent transcriptional regulator